MSAHYVYRCYDKTGRLIYVGCTKNVRQRMTLHRNPRSESLWWQDQVAEITVKPYASLAEARAAEREAVFTENPRWNLKIKDQFMHLWKLSDFDDYFTSLSRIPSFRWVGPRGTWRRAERELAHRFPELFKPTDVFNHQ